MITVGLLPVLAWAALANAATRRFLSVSFHPVEALLEEVDQALTHHPEEATLARNLRQSRLHLAQAELARRSLARLAPRALILVVLVSGGVLGLSAFLLGRSIARPVERLALGMTRCAAGDLSHRLPETPGAAPDELEYLVRIFNHMAAELERQRARLEVTEALAAWQGAARELAHELKNPLTAMRLAVGRLVRTEKTEPRQHEALGLMESQIDALLRMADSFSAFARLPVPTLAAIDLAALAHEVCDLYRHQAPAGLDCEAEQPVRVSADAALLRQALGNLVKNAIEAGGDGPVRVTVGTDGPTARIDVLDAGPGISVPLTGAQLTRPVRSTKARGSGLGLPIAQKIVHEHGGSLSLSPRPGRGTRATIHLPREGDGGAAA